MPLKKWRVFATHEHVRDSFGGRFIRIICQACGAHALVHAPLPPATSCDVCGGEQFVPAEPHALDDADARPRRANLS
jgi:ribosomal protein S27E